MQELPSCQMRKQTGRYELEVDNNPGKPRQRLTGKQQIARGPHLGGDPDHEEAVLPQEQEEGPALRELQAGGEYYTDLQKFWVMDQGRGEFEQTLGAYQWGLKEALAEEIKVVPMGEELGFARWNSSWVASISWKTTWGTFRRTRVRRAIGWPC